MRKLYLTSYTFETEKGERVKDYRLVAVTKADVDQMFPSKATHDGESCASKKLVAFLALENPSMKILETRSTDAIDAECIMRFPNDSNTIGLGQVVYSSNETPKPDRHYPDEFSEKVLIDLDGRRIDFCIGKFDYQKKVWVYDSCVVREQDYPTFSGWMYLPVDRDYIS